MNTSPSPIFKKNLELESQFFKSEFSDFYTFQAVLLMINTGFVGEEDSLPVQGDWLRSACARKLPAGRCQNQSWWRADRRLRQQRPVCKGTFQWIGLRWVDDSRRENTCWLLDRCQNIDLSLVKSWCQTKFHIIYERAKESLRLYKNKLILGDSSGQTTCQKFHLTLNKLKEKIQETVDSHVHLVMSSEGEQNDGWFWLGERGRISNWLVQFEKKRNS